MIWGHPVNDVWAMTPRQVHAWLALGVARETRERATMLADTALASRGKGEAITKAFREMGDA